ncbi:MAG: hypothetical protein RIB60_07005 [Phycisphaerales bacterium]
MRHAMKTTGATALGGLVLSCGTALAGPVNANHVPGSAKWVAHVDLEAAGGTEIGRFMLDMIERESDGYADIRKGIRGFTLSPEGGLRGITIFGRELDEESEDFVALVYGDERIASWGDEIRAKMLEHGYDAPKIEADGNRVLIVPADEDNPIFASMARSGGDHVWIVTRSANRSGRGASFISGGGKTNEDLASLGWKSGTIAFAAVENPSELADFDDVSHIAEQAERVMARVGEAGGEVFAEARLDTHDPKQADQIARMADGLLALGALMSAEDQELARVMEFARGIRVRAEDGSLLVSMSHSAAELKGLIVEMNGDDGDWDEHDADDWDDDHNDDDDFWGDDG